MFRRSAIGNVFVEVLFSSLYAGVPLFCDINAALKDKGFTLYGLYSLSPGYEGYLMWANALYRLER